MKGDPDLACPKKKKCYLTCILQAGYFSLACEQASEWVIKLKGGPPPFLPHPLPDRAELDTLKSERTTRAREKSLPREHNATREFSLLFARRGSSRSLRGSPSRSLRGSLALLLAMENKGPFIVYFTRSPVHETMILCLLGLLGIDHQKTHLHVTK